MPQSFSYASSGRCVRCMRVEQRTSSLFLVLILIFSTVLVMIPVLPISSAYNETNAGTITGTEEWQGIHNVQGDIVIAEGATLIIHAGTTVNMPSGAFIEVEGALCAGSSACGATPAGTGSPVRFIWSDAPVSNQTGRCYSATGNPDLNCGEGIILRQTVDTALTKLSFVTFEGAYGTPTFIQSNNIWAFGALMFDGASVEADHLTFSNINTSNAVIYNSAAPSISDSTFVLGTDGQGWDASSVRAYGAGIGILSTLSLTNSAFTGNPQGECGTQGDGKSSIYVVDSYVDMDTLSISQNAYGIFLKGTSGTLTNSNIADVNCNGVDTNGHKSTGSISHVLYVNNNTITTGEGAPFTAYDAAIVEFNDNTISGASEGSGIGIRDSTVVANRNVIGPIGKWNGFWIYGSSDVIAENNTIQMGSGAHEPVLVGEYHFRDDGWNVPNPTKARLYLANNEIMNNSGICNSVIYGGEFPCPAIHVFMSSATIVGNTVTDNIGDGIRSTGGIINVQNNEIHSSEFAARISAWDNNYGDKYASIGFFSGNNWTGTPKQTYNVTESKAVLKRASGCVVSSVCSRLQR